MSYIENLLKATELKKELDGFRPLTPEVEKRIMQKFRLDWNYHSSHIEGNQLTFGETKALLLFGTTAQAKPLKDHLEMKGHNEAILNLEEVIQEKRPLTENFIRELHELILHEPYEVDAITPDGKPTRKTISIGQYKTVPNHVKTKTGEIFYFASPEETPIKMAELMQWYNDNKDDNTILPVLFATEFHYRFICIHPFDDGNGRIARLLMNFILMLKGYPPAIIKAEDKERYYAALQQADAGDLAFFFNYVCKQVICSLDLMIKGAKGESIDEPDDLDKKLALLEQEIEAEGDEQEIKVELSKEIIKQIANEWMIPLFTSLEEIAKKFEKFYHGFNTQVFFNIDNVIVESSIGLFINAIETHIHEKKFVYKASIQYKLTTGAYKKGGAQPFSCNYNVEIVLKQLSYSIGIPVFNQETKGNDYMMIVENRLLHKPLTETEKNKIIKLWSDSLFNYLDYNRNQITKG